MTFGGLGIFLLDTQSCLDPAWLEGKDNTESHSNREKLMPSVRGMKAGPRK